MTVKIKIIYYCEIEKYKTIKSDLLIDFILTLMKKMSI